MADKPVRLPAVAGMFYPEDSITLDLTVKELLAAVSPAPVAKGELLALIVPHAGYVYSGLVAAHSYKLLQGRDIDYVILCGPSHRYGFHGLSVAQPGSIWKTPLGELTCNETLCRHVLKHPWMNVVPKAHEAEHSLEVQLPFLQIVLPGCEIVPIVMGYQQPEIIEALSRTLTSLNLDKGIMIVSTDWQHYRSAQAGWKLDSLGIDCLMKLDDIRLEKYLEDGSVEMCGGCLAVAVMRAAKKRGANHVQLLKYAHSGQQSGDNSKVVGYVAAAIYRIEETDRSEELMQTNEADSSYLSIDQKSRLLEIARESLTQYLRDGTKLIPSQEGIFGKPGAAFVTLKKDGHLRGCIGYTQAVEPLASTVAHCAIQAGVADPRFPAVTLDEVSSLHIEITVLTPMQKIDSLNEIIVGRDGLMIVSNNGRGLLLPQVATENNWDRTTFLRQTCRKAGLPKDAYLRPEIDIFRFQGLIFSED